MVIIIKKIINDYCKLTNNIDIRTSIIIDVLTSLRDNIEYFCLDNQFIINSIFYTTKSYKNFNVETLFKTITKYLDLPYYIPFDNFLIKRGIKDSFIKNMVNYNNWSLDELMLRTNPNNFIRHAFFWEGTKEKHKYWSRFDTEWKNHVQNLNKYIKEKHEINEQQMLKDISNYLIALNKNNI